ncbi:MAG: antibiotic biosynthesis monooxygenase [Hyphomonadaceae bacterium]|nr:antibiotic biosynthesis monooxygenase [Hyphomonadaceae bacterium]
MILIQGHIRVAPETIAKLKAAAAPLITATREEPGCLAYSFAEDIADPGLVHIAERWASEEALDAHNRTAHLTTFMGQLPALAPQAIRVARYDGAGERVLVGA